MSKMLKVVVILILLASIGALVMGVMNFQQRQALLGRAQKFEKTVLAVADSLASAKPPHIAALDAKPQAEQLKDYENMDSALSVFATMANLRYGELSQTADTLQDTRDQLGETQRELTQTQNQLRASQAQVATLEQTVARKDAEIARLNLNISDLQTQVADLEKTVADKDAEIVVLKDTIDDQKDYIVLLENRAGTTAAGTATSTPDGLTGHVVLVNPAWNFVVLDIGSEHKLSVASVLLVHRDETLVGKIRVTQVNNNVAVGEIMRDWEKIPMREGDTVFYPGRG